MQFIAERTSELRDRLPDALIDPYVIPEDERLPLPRNREHIFDFDDNMRLVVTRMENTEWEFHVVASPAGGPVFVGYDANGIIKAVMERIKDIGLMDIIGKADVRVELICGGHLHVKIRRGSGVMEVVSKCSGITIGSGHGDCYE